MKIDMIQPKLNNQDQVNSKDDSRMQDQENRDHKNRFETIKYRHHEKVFLYLDSNDQVTQSHICVSEDQYWNAFRILIEHCIEDYGKEFTCGALDHALFKNNLPPQPSEYCEEGDY